MLARQGDNDKCQEPRVPFLAHFEVHSDGTKLRFALLKKNGRKGTRHDRPIEKRAGSCELTDTPSARARSYQRDQPKGLPWPLCFITSTNCADAHTVQGGNKENGKHGITVPWNPSSPRITDPWRRLQIKPSTMTAMALQSSSPA